MPPVDAACRRRLQTESSRLSHYVPAVGLYRIVVSGVPAAFEVALQSRRTATCRRETRSTASGTDYKAQSHVYKLLPSRDDRGDGSGDSVAGSTTSSRERSVSSVTAPKAPSHFRADIQGLRAVAVGLVLLDHVFGWPHGGFIGVDVFFVISGFLITGLLVRERQRTGRISYKGFYARRARRILPAAVAVLVVTDIAAWALFIGDRAHQIIEDSIWGLLFAANVHFAQQGTDYFQAGGQPSPFQHFWSLSVEEQFYLVWPALILAVLWFVRGRRRGFALGAVMLAVSAASLLWSMHATDASPTIEVFSPRSAIE